MNLNNFVIVWMLHSNNVLMYVRSAITGKLLESQDLHEVAVGLIATTGRRPHEILARAKFTPVDGQSYQVMFTSQGKKRGDKPVFSIATLYPASYVIERLNWLRKEPSIKALLTEVARKKLLLYLLLENNRA